MWGDPRSPPNADRETKGLASKLSSPGIPVTTRFTTAGHNWTNWQDNLHRAWPQLMSAIGA